ncbi:copper ion binding protein [Actinomadura sp. DC4]|uniref:heavy-metal-associated domain-containing protein n=1 Tax=Actinomadura sp. DC4 TaxID=3055069 RepID=UPI0025AF5070|nr:copper ion binding protein [Actinomadura sp. DC4]MDN3352937.1 copper ion binding protein [Actinomadura sp. DC4]
MITTRYAVKGMTCDHCVSAVSSEVGRIDGVTGVDVDLATGAVTVTSDTAVAETAVREAVDEAGYEVVGS